MLDQRLGLSDAAKILGRSTRQVRRDVRDGKLRADGGGRGKALFFKPADLEIEKNKRGGVFNSDLLARAVHALHQMRDGKKEAFPPSYVTYRLWRTDRDSNLFKYDREGFPPLSSVSSEILDSVRGLCAGLLPSEIDYLGAMTICVAQPSRRYTRTENKAVQMAYDSVHGVRGIANYNAYNKALNELIFSTDGVDALESYLFEDAAKRAARPSLQKKSFMGSTWSEMAPSKLAWIRLLRVGLNPKRGQDFRSVFMRAVRKIALDHKEMGVGFPTGNRVAGIIGLSHRYSGSQIVRQLRNKLGRNGVLAWFRLLGIEYPPPLIWIAKPKKI